MGTLHRFKQGRHEVETFGSWYTALVQRDFQGAIDHFISALIEDTAILTDGRVALETQRLVTNLINQRRIHMDFFFYIMVTVVAAIGSDTIIKMKKASVEERRLKVEEEKLAIQRLELEMKREQDNLEHRGF